MSASLASLMYAFIGLPLLAVAGLNLAGRRLTRRICQSLGVFVGLAQMAVAVISQLLLLQYHKSSVSFSEFWDMTLADGAAYLRVDTFSLIALFCVGLAVTAAFLLKWFDSERNAFNFTNMALLLMLGLNGAALVTDLFSLYIFIEISGLCSYTLTALYRDERGLEGGFKQLIMGALASALILMGLAFMFMESGSLRYDALAQFYAEELPLPILDHLAFLFLISGIGLKAGLVPFHFWLPDAYEGAPAPVAVLLSGAATQMIGTYALIRIMGELKGMTADPVANMILLLLGLLTIFVGALGALGQQDLKRCLAYSVISQLGYIVLGVSCGNVFGFVGAILHFFTLSLGNTVLFLDAAAVSLSAGTTDMLRLGGLQKQMPVVGITNLIAFLSNAGLPPTVGFWSKLLIIIAVWQSGSGFIAGLALVSGILTVACFLRVQNKVFFGPDVEELSAVSGPRGGIAVSSLTLSGMIILAGLLIPFLLRMLQARGLF
ncbi:MAG: NADH-quinone oxidoreductase subunit L [Firmicutes bacterium]|nr:NADH-quinone oxidoreductase subunit L [Bacillota bacterium]